jgi:hypothetical protein
MSDEKKMTADELKAWDMYAAAALTAIIDVNDEAHGVPSTAELVRRGDAIFAARYADEMLIRRRQRTNPHHTG